MKSYEVRTESNSKPKHTKLGISSFICCILALLLIILHVLSVGLIFEALPFTLLFGAFAIIFTIAAFILSMIDLRKPNRLKGLPISALVISSLFIILYMVALFPILYY